MNLLRVLRLGRTIPAIIAIVFLGDFSARFFTIDALAFRGWEALVRYRAPCGPFRANAVYNNPASYGDLSVLGNLPQYRIYHPEIFTTDAHGVRRNSRRGEPHQDYKVILLGDSMAVGSSVNDEETLAARLQAELAVGVYNGGTPGQMTLDIPEILQLARNLNMTEGTVIYQYIGRGPLPALAQLAGQSAFSCADWQNWLTNLYEGFVDTSPLKIMAQKLIRSLQNDAILPNIYRAEVAVRRLTDGNTILFFPPDVSNYSATRSVDLTGVRYLATELGKNKLRLVVVLVPDKFVVYEPMLIEPDRAQHHGALYLNMVEQSLKETGIPVINLTRFMKDKAGEYYARKQYLYWRDDTHWNVEGIKLAAKEIVQRKLIR
jgi:hypothetical protein